MIYFVNNKTRLLIKEDVLNNHVNNVKSYTDCKENGKRKAA